VINKLGAIAVWLIMVYFDVWSKIHPSHHIWATAALWITFFSDDGWPISYRVVKEIVHKKGEQTE